MADLVIVKLKNPSKSETRALASGIEREANRLGVGAVVHAIDVSDSEVEVWITQPTPEVLEFLEAKNDGPAGLVYVGPITREQSKARDAAAALRALHSLAWKRQQSWRGPGGYMDESSAAVAKWWAVTA